MVEQYAKAFEKWAPREWGRDALGEGGDEGRQGRGARNQLNTAARAVQPAAHALGHGPLHARAVAPGPTSLGPLRLALRRLGEETLSAEPSASLRWGPASAGPKLAARLVAWFAASFSGRIADARPASGRRNQGARRPAPRRRFLVWSGPTRNGTPYSGLPAPPPSAVAIEASGEAGQGWNAACDSAVVRVWGTA
jgi:hypothetical protein